jgi:flagellar hook-associated protein 3 FlgL
MDLNISSKTQQYLNNLNYIQSQMTKAQTEVSSGLKIQQASDDPGAIGTVFEDQTAIAMNQQVQTNLGSAQAELSAADTALQSSISLVSNALSLASEGASTTASANDRANLATQVAGLQQTLVSLSQTNVNGLYIFSGDQETQPSYQLDNTQPEGVKQLLTTTATRTIADANGAPIAIAKTAQEIFDAQLPAAGGPAPGNVFNAINSLLTALQNNNQAGITQASTLLQSSSDYLNSQLVFYGNAETQVQSALDAAQKSQVQNKANLGNVQDADLAAAALQLTQTQTQQQAALSVAAKVQQTPNLFSYLG